MPSQSQSRRYFERKNHTRVPRPYLTLSAAAESWIGESMYNSLQAKLEKRYSQRLEFLATYTWAMPKTTLQTLESGGGPHAIGTQTSFHSKTRSPTPITIPVSASQLNGLYELPFGKAGNICIRAVCWTISSAAGQPALPGLRKPASRLRLLLAAAAIMGALSAYQINAIKIGDPFKGGGTRDPRNIDMGSQTCPAIVHNRQNWYNPCAFIDPGQGTAIPVGTILTDEASAIQYSGGKADQVHGPG